MVTSIPFLIARVTDEDDFLKLKELANGLEGWHLEYDRTVVKVWSRVVSDANIKMYKVWAIFSGVSSTLLYNALMDPIYRKQWDNHVIVAYDIGLLNHNNAICYYAASCPPPLRSRDFVLQSSWLDMHTEHFMLNHSVCHKDHPPRPGYIRAISYFTGYYIKALVDDGSEMTFVTQTDPQGIIPAWLVNKCTRIFAPRFVTQVEKAAFAYKAWKSQNNPDYYPWVYPEQMKSPIISVADCVPSAEERQSSFFMSLTEKYLKMEAGPENSYHGLPINTPGSSKVTIPSYDHKSVKNLKVEAKMNEGGKKRKQKTE